MVRGFGQVERSRCGITARGIIFSRVDCSVLFEGGRIIGRFSPRWLSEGSVGFKSRFMGWIKAKRTAARPRAHGACGQPVAQSPRR